MELHTFPTVSADIVNDQVKVRGDRVGYDSDEARAVQEELREGEG